MHRWLEQDNVKPFVRLLCRILLTTLAAIFLAHAIPTFFTFFLPFIMAFLIASAMNPLISRLQKRLNATRGVLSVLMVAIALLCVAAIVGGFLYALGREIVSLAQNIDGIMEYLSQTIAIASDHLYWLLDYLPTDAEEVISGLVNGFMAWVQVMGTAFADAVITQTVAATARLGGGIVSIIIFIMASYFIMADYPRIAENLKNLFTKKLYKGYSTLKNAALSALGGYLRAQLLMAFVTFAISFVALLAIRQEFALLLALLLGFLDFVPVVGTSIVLVPWGIISIVGGSVARGIYLIALSLVAFLLRRVIEPKVVGSQMGLSPLMTLISIYIGMQLGGVLGLILGPIVAMIFINLYKAGLFDGWIKDIKAVLKIIQSWNIV